MRRLAISRDDFLTYCARHAPAAAAAGVPMVSRPVPRYTASAAPFTWAHRLAKAHFRPAKVWAAAGSSCLPADQLGTRRAGGRGQ
jgi:hypothetical protein